MVATLPPQTSEEPPAEGAPTCIICGAVGVWQSPTGHWACEDCKRMVNLTRMSPEELAAGAIPERWGTLSELLEEDLEPIRWLVKGLIPEGLTFIAGKTKIGKTWFTYLLALAVCSGQDFLGMETKLGEVLTVALEDGKRRIQDRVKALGGIHIKEHLHRYHYRTEWPTFNQGALQHLERWMIEHPDTRLIIIDTWGRIRGTTPGKDHYSEEYTLLGSLQAFATEHRIAVVLVHHLRKMGADDWIEQLSGSQAVTGAADTILGLYRERGQMDATLKTVSRDAEELELALRFENDSRWVFMGEAVEYRLSVERAAVLDALRDLGGEGQVKDIAELVGKTGANTSKLLNGLERDKLVVRVKHGVYAVLERVVEVVEVVDIKPRTDIPNQPNQPLQPRRDEDRDGLEDSSLEELDFDPADLDWQEEE